MTAKIRKKKKDLEVFLMDAVYELYNIYFDSAETSFSLFPKIPRINEVVSITVLT